MRIVFIGTVEFSLQALNTLIDIDANVVGVCTKGTSSFNSDFANLIPSCEKSDIPYNLVDNINSKENINWIDNLKPDIIFCFGWSSLIKKELLALAPMGVIGYHPAKLPQNRGRHPLIWVLVLGVKKSASTFFFMEEGADNGDILSQIKFDISYEDDASTLYQKVISIALEQIKIFVPQLQAKKYARVKQNHNLSNTWRKRGKPDGIIDFRMSSRAIYNLVRGLTKPYIGANVIYKGKDIIIWKVEEVKIDMNNIEPGKILDIQDDRPLVKSYDGAILISEHEFIDLPKVGEYL